jgi:putative radical SAM enzyme (TIGR03279 family)
MALSTAAPLAPAPPRVLAVVAGSAADRAGVVPGDEIVAIDGVVPRDVLEYQQLVDEAGVVLTLRRGGVELDVEVPKAAGEPFGVEVHAALFDQVRTCDNHCEFCFIYQLPPGMRKSLYVKDDDYRLSFLYGNFTTLTRFTEADLERVITEGLSPLHVSIHSADPATRNDLLRNRRGGPSLRWLRALLDHGIEVHGQIVVCPGLNDGDELDHTLAELFDQYTELATVCVVPLGVSKFNREPRMRPHTVAEAERVVDIVAFWQQTFFDHTGRRVVHAADEYYLLAGRPFPPPEAYEGFSMYEDGVGMAQSFALELRGEVDDATGPRAGFFASVDGAPAEGYRSPRIAPTGGGAAAAPAGVVTLRPRRGAPIGILTAPLGAAVLEPLVAELGRPDVRVITVVNEFFGGNTGVTGLMVGADIARTLRDQPAGHRYLLPDVCLTNGVFLDGMAPHELPHPVEIIPTDGHALRTALGEPSPPKSEVAP